MSTSILILYEKEKKKANDINSPLLMVQGSKGRHVAEYSTVNSIIKYRLLFQ